MDSGALSALSALGGTMVGALSSLSSTWMTTRAQARAARLADERAKREDLYGRYMDEIAHLYAAALKSVGVDYERLTSAYALSGRISLHAGDAVVEASDNALRYVVDLALGPTRSAEEMRTMMDDRSANVISAFAKACREELRTLR